MSAIYILIGASLVVATGFLIAFLWAVKSGQMDDRYTPSVRMLFDDEIKISKKQNDSSLSNEQEKKELN
ncbi:MAG: cbb3-type cytochrome oxidase assembly protein CcoS [Ignavibacteriales bacterium]|jgi:cbb3-type cytochrome oxidase maturation protein|nr:cbb3-type cytochrome oxidase assembly protein CcoS [Ignavibacteriales bacterium]MBK8660693.1 cbb3-type cytochrome oxidase assembly protein CcoS [Ignavibacteriales bacterium]MBP9121758.1 cbb3-type cytochrome oxidase assembly protein CcoS [Ignavibacteriaceae bacterium]MCC6637501.1 cbb3-type cytochrome oxidase assembly protein CcoS [Ignavibacteriaceae bacterium]